jgi:hypothetical protein
MNNGDILTELRAWRDEFARSHGYDLGAMAAALRELDGAAGARVVRGQPRRPAAVPPKDPGAPHHEGSGSAKPDLPSVLRGSGDRQPGDRTNARA